MNREILHKGISKKGGKWVGGDFYHAKQSDQYFIVTEIWPGNANFIQIIPGTDCQFTGTTDKKGKKVFEGDYDADGNIVVWCEKCHGLAFGLLNIPTNDMFINCHACEGNFLFGDHIGDFEVIGNINDR